MLFLDFGINMRQVTGIVVALHGKETDAGDFSVLDILEAGLPPQIEKSFTSSTVYYFMMFQMLCMFKFIGLVQYFHYFICRIFV